MKDLWLEKHKCTGCGMCSNICPHHAITMEPDKCGFIYPSINNDCINCNICEKKCNLRCTPENNYTIPIIYAAWSKNEDTRYSSTSGGLCTELIYDILNDGGYVAGAAYNDDNLVEHIIIHSLDEIDKIRQSKYIQSNPGEVYSLVKKHLLNGEKVAFCGAPCQVSALYAFLMPKSYDNLYTIDFICRGMNSPKAYKSWLDEIETNEKKRISRVWFKYKEGGWNTSPKRTRIDFTDGTYVVKEQEDNLFMHGYLTSNLYIRPSCGDCSFKGVPRQADITLADFWGIEKELDDDKGTSLVLINNPKGSELFNAAKERIFYQKRDFNEIFAGNVCFTESVHVPEKSVEFLSVVGNEPFSLLVHRYTKVPFLKRVGRKVKRIYKTLLHDRIKL